MSRREFIRIAEVMKANIPRYHKKGSLISAAELVVWRTLTRAMADYLEETNPFFDRVKWLAACDYDSTYPPR